MLNIQLIQPAKSKGYVSNSRTGCYVPLGLVSIATYAKMNFLQAYVEVFDGELMTNKEITSKLKPNAVVGIETKTPNYASAIEIAKIAKEIGCTIVFGGVYAQAIPQTIMNQRSDIVDHIVVGFGEKPLVDIIIRDSQQRIIYNPNPSFDELPTPDRNSFVNLETYVANFQKEHPTWNSRGTNIFTHVGCKYNCIFCSRTGPKKSIYFRNPTRIWEEVAVLVREHDINYLVDFSDAITQNLEWLREFVKAKPYDINPILHVFSNADGITNESLELLKRLNTKHIFIGAETGDEQLAETVMKGGDFSPEKTLKAVELITREGIGITPSFVLGLPGETEETLNKTYEFAKRIHDISGFEEIFCSALIPFPGSTSFEMLRKRHILDTDMLDPEELKKLWIDSFCNVDYETITTYSQKILDLGKYQITIKKQTQ